MGQKIYSSKPFMTATLDRGGWPTPHSGRFSPGKIRYSLYRKLSLPRTRWTQVREVSAAPGLKSWIVKPVASHYTDRHSAEGTAS